MVIWLTSQPCFYTTQSMLCINTSCKQDDGPAKSSLIVLRRKITTSWPIQKVKVSIAQSLALLAPGVLPDSCRINWGKNTGMGSHYFSRNLPYSGDRTQVYYLLLFLSQLSHQEASRMALPSNLTCTLLPSVCGNSSPMLRWLTLTSHLCTETSLFITVKKLSA